MLRYPARVRELAKTLAGRALSGLIWANSNLFTRRAAFAAAPLTGWPVVLDVWDTPDLPMWSQYREGRYLRALAHRAMSIGVAGRLRAADLVVWTLHPDAANRYFRPDRQRLLLLPNGFRRQELAAFQIVEASARQETGPQRRLFYMGHFQRSRGSQVLLESLARLRRDNLPVELHVAGATSSPAARDAVRRIPDRLRP